MAHSETSDQRVRRTTAIVACLFGAVLAVSCNVYDASLLDSSPLANGGIAGGSIVTGNGGMPAGGAPPGTPDAGAGEVGDAGANNSSGGAGTTVGGSGGGVAGGASGGSSEAGAASGGASGGGSAGAPGNPIYSLIDDMEMPDPNIPATDSRKGFWSLANDGSGTQVPATMVMSVIPGGRDTSMHALHTTTTGFKTGPQVGVDLFRTAASRGTYDASAFKGVHFWAKVGATSNKDVHFSILDRHTDPGGGLCCEAEKTCTGTANIANGLCYDNFAKDLSFTTAWAEYNVWFSDLDQVGWANNKEGGKPVVALDAPHVFAIQFNWGTEAMDLWIDDISFVKK